MIPKKPAPDVIRGGYRFSDKIMLQQKAGASTAERGAERREIPHDEIGLMRRLAERPAAAVDEGGAHAERFGADAVEGVIGDEENMRAVRADDLLGLGVGLPVRLEIA